jgi:hypothetical protein
MGSTIKSNSGHFPNLTVRQLTGKKELVKDGHNKDRQEQSGTPADTYRKKQK